MSTAMKNRDCLMLRIPIDLKAWVIAQAEADIRTVNEWLRRLIEAERIRTSTEGLADGHTTSHN